MESFDPIYRFTDEYLYTIKRLLPSGFVTPECDTRNETTRLPLLRSPAPEIKREYVNAPARGASHLLQKIHLSSASAKRNNRKMSSSHQSRCQKSHTPQHLYQQMCWTRIRRSLRWGTPGWELERKCASSPHWGSAVGMQAAAVGRPMRYYRVNLLDLL